MLDPTRDFSTKFTKALLSGVLFSDFSNIFTFFFLRYSLLNLGKIVKKGQKIRVSILDALVVHGKNKSLETTEFNKIE